MLLITKKDKTVSAAVFAFYCHCGGTLAILRNAAALMFFAAILLLPQNELMAIGTPSGTNIVNQATVSYSVGPANFVVNSNVTTTRVAEIIDVNAQWQDATPISVNPGDTAKVTTFVVTNVGNGNDSYTLDGISRLDGDDFDPTYRGIFLDTNCNGIYDTGVDAQYIQGVNDPVLNADQAVIVFVLNDIPINLPDGNRGHTQLLATSSLGNGPPGTILPGQGDFGLDAILGTSGGDDSDIGVYLVSNITITLTKSVSISDMFGGQEPIPGATLLYTISLSATGSGGARGVVVTDSIPENTTYTPGTLTLNSISLSDELDGDAGDVGRTIPGVVTVNLGDIAIPLQDQIITFRVTIN
jgi:uncharacterized repeat protein (TIGR01451 family)